MKQEDISNRFSELQHLRNLPKIPRFLEKLDAENSVHQEILEYFDEFPDDNPDQNIINSNDLETYEDSSDKIVLPNGIKLFLNEDFTIRRDPRVERFKLAFNSTNPEHRNLAFRQLSKDIEIAKKCEGFYSEYRISLKHIPKFFNNPFFTANIFNLIPRSYNIKIVGSFCAQVTKKFNSYFPNSDITIITTEAFLLKILAIFKDYKNNKQYLKTADQTLAELYLLYCCICNILSLRQQNRMSILKNVDIDTIINLSNTLILAINYVAQTIDEAFIYSVQHCIAVNQGNFEGTKDLLEKPAPNNKNNNQKVKDPNEQFNDLIASTSENHVDMLKSPHYALRAIIEVNPFRYLTLEKKIEFSARYDEGTKIKFREVYKIAKEIKHLRTKDPSPGQIPNPIPTKPKQHSKPKTSITLNKTSYFHSYPLTCSAVTLMLGFGLYAILATAPFFTTIDIAIVSVPCLIEFGISNLTPQNKINQDVTARSI